MSLQPIKYQGRFVAAATRERFFLADELEQRARGDAEATFVMYMCLYARDILTGRLDEPYSDDRAREFARAALIPTEILERNDINYKRAAHALGVPTDELREAYRTAKAGAKDPAVAPAVDFRV